MLLADTCAHMCRGCCSARMSAQRMEIFLPFGPSPGSCWIIIDTALYQQWRTTTRPRTRAVCGMFS
eukprot:3280928-Prymnesium_polylepis.1